MYGHRSKAAVAFGLMFLVSGTTHFTNPDGFVAIVPPFLSDPQRLVYMSGVAEIGLGLGLLVPRLRAWAGLGAILLLLSVFPANIYAAMNEIRSPGSPENSFYLWIRLPLQLVFIVWVWMAGGSELFEKYYLQSKRQPGS